MHCASCSDRKVTGKGSDWVVVLKGLKSSAGSSLTRGRAVGLKLAAVLLPAGDTLHNLHVV